MPATFRDHDNGLQNVIFCEVCVSDRRSKRDLRVRNLPWPDTGAISMSFNHASPGWNLIGVGLVATLTAWGVDWNVAQAREAHPHAPTHEAHNGAPAKEGHKGGGRHGVLHGANYHPPFSAIVVDDNSGHTLYEMNADEPRHPASLTKIMTLYMLFEQLEAGKFKLDTQLPISGHAAGQAPVKLGLKAGQTIAVEDALRAMVTKSANDAACVVAEAIGGGDEAEGARLMTAKARALGMASTTYVNGSGLPAEEQITTARDQALLGLIIHNRFPNYYRYFSTLNFNWHGRDMHNHNGLLGNVPGVDGIKTGYTEASGYNLVASVQRDNRHIVSVVLGGTSNGARDTLMRKLIEEHVAHASALRTAPALTEVANGVPANPILTVNGTPAPAVAAAPVPPAPIPAAPVVAAAPPPAATPAPAVAPGANIQTANPILPPASATLRDGLAIPMSGPKADQAKTKPSKAAAEKPRFRGPRQQANAPALPQGQGAAPVVTAAHVVRQRSPSTRAEAAGGAAPHRAPSTRVVQ
jgi:D-alanyl-D-alanine carboxypeptidase